MPLILLCVAVACIVMLVIGAILKTLRKKHSPFAVDMGEYICALRKDALPDSAEKFDDLLRKYLSQGTLDDERDLARQLNALSYKRVGELFVELMQLDYTN